MSRAGIRWDDAAGAGRPRRACCATARRLGRRCSRTSTARTPIPAPSPCSGSGSRRCWRRCPADRRWSTPPTAAPPSGAAPRGRPDPPGHLSLRRRRGRQWPAPSRWPRCAPAWWRCARRRRRDRELRRHLARAARDDGRHARASGYADGFLRAAREDAEATPRPAAAGSRAGRRAGPGRRPGDDGHDDGRRRRRPPCRAMWRRSTADASPSTSRRPRRGRSPTSCSRRSARGYPGATGGSHERTLRVAGPRPRPPGGGGARRDAAAGRRGAWATGARWRRR